VSRQKDRRTTLPQLVETAEGYRVFAPELVKDRKDLLESMVRDDLRYTNNGPEDSLLWTTTVIGAAALPLLLGASVLSYILWFLVGIVGGFVVGAAAAGIIAPDREKEYREEHRGADPWTEVEAGDPKATVCALAEDIALTRAWQDGILDPQRHLASIVWSAVSKNAADATDEDAEDVEVVTENLRELLRVARDLDHRREYGTPAVDERISAREPTARARALSSEALENGRAVRDML
jgi:gas vesicle protein